MVRSSVDTHPGTESAPQARVWLVGIKSLVVVAVCWFVPILYVQQNHADALVIQAWAHRIQAAQLQARRFEKDFLLRALTDPTFFEQGTSPHLARHEQALADLHADLQMLRTLIAPEHFDRVNALDAAMRHYAGTFAQLVQAYRQQGFKDWGLVGEWRVAAHRVEDVFEGTGRPRLAQQWLSVRRAEKDYLLRRESQYYEQVLSRVATIRTQLSAEKSVGGMPLRETLDGYERAFMDYVAMDRTIGLTAEQGLRGTLRDAIHKMSPIIQQLSVEARQQADNTGVWLHLVLVVAGAAMVMLAAVTVVSRAIARSRAQVLDVQNQELRRMQDDLRTLLQEAQERNLALKEARNQAVKSDQLKSEFVATISHELRTPLNGIVGIAEILASTSLDADQGDYVRTIQTSSDALLHIVNDILDFSKFEAGGLEVEHTVFSLHDLVDKLLAEMAEPAARRSLEFFGWVHPDVPDHVTGDSRRVGQVLRNLLHNAIKFTEAGTVSFAVVPNNDGQSSGLRFEVKDTGIGLSAEAMSRLFQPFTQVDGSMTRKYGGTGLGLVICQRLVHMMYGEIGVESELDVGSLFWVTLPLEAIPGGAAMQDDRTALRGCGMCVVDDHWESGEVMVRYAEAWGMTADLYTTADAARDGIRHAHRAGARYDVVVCERSMWLTTRGGQSAETRAEDDAFADVPVVWLTSVMCQQEAPVSAPAQVVGAVTKPVLPRRLYGELCRAMGKQCEDERVLTALAHDSTPDVKASRPTPSTQAPKMLVVEDSVPNQEILRRMLHKLGYGSDIVANGKEAVNAWEHGAYDMIFMDCQMPEMDGYEAAGEIRRREKHWCVRASQARGDFGAPTCDRIPIVAVTANAMVGDREKCLHSGMDDFMAKPVRLGELRTMIERWLPVAHSG